MAFSVTVLDDVHDEGEETGESDQCGGPDAGKPQPAFLRREPVLGLTAGIVTRRDDPLQSAAQTDGIGILIAWKRLLKPSCLDGFVAGGRSCAQNGRHSLISTPCWESRLATVLKVR